MIERVARAICVAAGGSPDEDFFGRPFWQQYTGMAEAAIKAMREPTQAMVSTQIGPATARDRARKAPFWRR